MRARVLAIISLSIATLAMPPVMAQTASVAGTPTGSSGPEVVRNTALMPALPAAEPRRRGCTSNTKPPAFWSINSTYSYDIDAERLGAADFSCTGRDRARTLKRVTFVGVHEFCPPECPDSFNVFVLDYLSGEPTDGEPVCEFAEQQYAGLETVSIDPLERTDSPDPCTLDRRKIYWIAIQAVAPFYKWYWRSTEVIDAFEGDWKTNGGGGTPCSSFQNDIYVGECLEIGTVDFIFEINY